MAAGDPVTDLSDQINLLTGGNGGAPEQLNWSKCDRVGAAAAASLTAGRPVSLWQYEGMPCAGAAPTTGVVPTNATTGAFPFTAPASGKKKRLQLFVGFGVSSGSLILYDRLSHQGGLSGTVISSQTTNLPTAALTRYTSGVGVQAWIEIYTAIGATSRTFTVGYDSDSGTGHTSQAAVIGNAGFQNAQRMLPIPLASGDKGFKAVNSVLLSATTGTAGNFGVTLGYPLCIVPLLSAAGGGFRAFLDSGGAIDLGTNSDACLAMCWVPIDTTTVNMMGLAGLFEK